MLTSAKLSGPWYWNVYFLKLHKCVYLYTKFQVSRTLVTSFRQGLTLPSPFPQPQNEPLKSPPRLGLKSTSYPFRRGIIKDLKWTYKYRERKRERERERERVIKYQQLQKWNMLLVLKRYETEIIRRPLLMFKYKVFSDKHCLRLISIKTLHLMLSNYLLLVLLLHIVILHWSFLIAYFILY